MKYNKLNDITPREWDSVSKYKRDPHHKNDMVNHPPHYNQSGIECLDAIKAATDKGFQYYLQGNIIKYIWRYRYKNGIEDVDKAIFYSKRLREVLENECKSNDDTKS